VSTGQTELAAPRGLSERVRFKCADAEFSSGRCHFDAIICEVLCNFPDKTSPRKNSPVPFAERGKLGLSDITRVAVCERRPIAFGRILHQRRDFPREKGVGLWFCIPGNNRVTVGSFPLN